MNDVPGYGLWSLAIINSLVFIIFALSFTRPRSGRDWRVFGGFAAFVVALFTEMYGVPLTIYFLWGWLAGRVEGLDLLSHDAGHLWQTLLGWKGDPHLNPVHLVSGVLIGGGFVLLARAWGPDGCRALPKVGSSNCRVRVLPAHRGLPGAATRSGPRSEGGQRTHHRDLARGNAARARRGSWPSTCASI